MSDTHAQMSWKERRPRRRRLIVQTLGTSRLVRIIVFDDEAREFVRTQVSEYGDLHRERGVENVYILAIDEAYDQIEVEAYIANYPEREAERQRS